MSGTESPRDLLGTADLHVVGLTVSSSLCDGLSEVLLAGDLKPVVLSEPDREECCVCIYCHGHDEALRAERTVHRILDECGDLFPRTAYELSVAVMGKADWMEPWKTQLHAVKIGKRFVVTPAWEEYERKAGEIVIRIDPGLSFGAGDHETTRACLELLEAIADEKLRGPAFDIGSGTGILSIVACLLGYGPVHAIDNYPEAVERTGQNIELNNVAEEVTCELSDIAEYVPGREYSLVMANLPCPLIIGHAGKIGECISFGGSLVVSGILDSQFSAVADCFLGSGFEIRQTVLRSHWRSGWFVRA